MTYGPSHVTTRDPRRFSDSTERNRDPILAVLERVLPPSGLVLEVASGFGQHAAYFAPRLPGVTWQPTDVEEDCLASARAWAAASDTPNLRDATYLDVTADAWSVAAADAVVAINLLHIAPVETGRALFRGAARVLRPGGVLYVYGPFKEGGAHTAPSNEKFDRMLSNRDPSWGVRDLDDVKAWAEAAGLTLAERVEMPANNLSLVFRKS